MQIQEKTKKKKFRKETIIKAIAITLACVIVIYLVANDLANQFDDIFGFRKPVHEYLLEEYNKQDFVTNPITESDKVSCFEKVVNCGLDIVTDNKLDTSKINSELKIETPLQLSANELHFLYESFHSSARFSSLINLQTRDLEFEYLQFDCQDAFFIVTCLTPKKLFDYEIYCVPNSFVVTGKYNLVEDDPELNLESLVLNGLSEEKNAEVLEYIGEVNGLLCASFNVVYIQEFLTNFCSTFNATFSIENSQIVFTPIVEIDTPTE